MAFKYTNQTYNLKTSLGDKLGFIKKKKCEVLMNNSKVPFNLDGVFFPSV